jgi:murein tripeptide amidase MpaA
MINVDGVVFGNYRCSLSGKDLNRQWQDPDPKVFPEVFHLKRKIKEFHERRQVVSYCDLHGHSN